MLDCVWFWKGGSEVGSWHCADLGTRDALRRAGYVAHEGSRTVGAPDGPPSKAELAAVLGR